MNQEEVLFPYEKIKRINQGTFAEVFEVCKGKYDIQTRKCDGKLYAEKVYTEGEPDYNEIDILSRFEHPHLLKSIELFVDHKGVFHLILPLAQKPYDLEKLIKIQEFDLDDTVKYIYQIISAIGFLHSQEYYHCDIKPSNVLLINNNITLADYSWSFHNAYDTETICGTPGYASPQGWEQGRLFKDEFYHEKLNQVQGDIYSIGTIFFECITGFKLNDYKQFLEPGKKIDDADNESYLNSEALILEMIKKVKDEEFRSAFDCIYNMCRLSQKERYKTINEVLQHPVFSSRVYTKIIPGKIKATNLPTTNMCDETILEHQSINHINDILGLDKTLVLTYITFYTLFYRNTNLIKEKSIDPKVLIDACIYISIKTFKPSSSPINYKEKLSRKGKYTQNDLLYVIFKILENVKGIIRVPSIYECTDNALEICWWLLMISKDCEYMSKSPKECHSLYAEIEANQSNLISSRVNKYDVKNIMFSKDNENTIILTYKKYDQVQELNIKWNNNKELVIE
jgi:serine/threonine protein kinase